ncbi:hypothetical protein [Streptomyces sp. NPDC057702]|uniref:hypothetical protein n=1 Tax=Streptomyces sp. NPDC057702 TaxID=3346221 RepID=UPI00368D0A42
MIEYHYIISVRTSQGAGHTLAGTVSVREGSTRQEAFHGVLAITQEEIDTRGSFEVTFFAFEPNRL